MFTFVGVKTENMLLKVEKRWVIAFIITAIVAMVSLFWPTKLPDASEATEKLKFQLVNKKGV